MLQQKLIIALGICLSFTSLSINAGGLGICNFDKQNLTSINCAGITSIQNSNIKGNSVIRGSFTALQTNFDSLDVMGDVKATSITVENNSLFKGRVIAEKCLFNAFNVIGSTQLSKTTILKEAQIEGNLSATQSSFEKNLTVNAQKVVLKQSEVKNNLLMRTTELHPVVEITCNSKVTGSIIFEKSAGIVKMTANSSVNKIVNGTKEIIEQHCGSN